MLYSEKNYEEYGEYITPKNTINPYAPIEVKVAMYNNELENAGLDVRLTGPWTLRHFLHEFTCMKCGDVHKNRRDPVAHFRGNGCRKCSPNEWQRIHEDKN